MGTIMKRWLILPAVLLLAATAIAQTTIKPAVIYSTGGKFDKSFNEGVSMGAGRFTKETGIAVAEFDHARRDHIVSGKQ